MADLISNTVTSIKDTVQKILNGLLPVSLLETLVLDAIPRPVEAVVYNLGVHASAILEVVILKVTPIEQTGIATSVTDPLLTLLTTVKSEIDGVLVPPAGSALLRLVPKIVTLVQTYLGTSGITPTSSATRAVMAQVEIQSAREAAVQKFLPSDSGATQTDGPSDVAAPPLNPNASTGL